MMDRDLLYGLLPEYYRFRDATLAAGGGAEQLREPLRAFLAVLEREYRRIEDATRAMFDNWFIETCDPSFFSWIGELVNLRTLSGREDLDPIFRTFVGNAVAFRRRKGTPIALERAAHAATGWHCRVIEFRNLISGTQNLRDRSATGLVNLRDQAALEFLTTPFATSSRTPSLREIRPGRAVMDSGTGALRGKYNLADVGIALWRLKSYAVSTAEPRRIALNCFTLHPMGVNSPLFNNPRTFDSWLMLARPYTVPEPIRPGALAREADLRRHGGKPVTAYLGDDPAISVRVCRQGGTFQPIASKDIYIRDLSAWATVGHARPVEDTVFLDPRTGRLQFAQRDPIGEVRVDYAYGFMADIGGGPYMRKQRSATAGGNPNEAPDWVAVVVSPAGAEAAAIRNTSIPAQDRPDARPRPETMRSPTSGIQDSGKLRGLITAAVTRLIRTRAGDNSIPDTGLIDMLIADAAGDAHLTLQHLDLMDRFGPRFSNSPAGTALLRARALELLNGRWPDLDFSGAPVFPTIQDAIDEWKTLLAAYGISGAIRIADTSIYHVGEIEAPISGASLTIESIEGQVATLAGDIIARGRGTDAFLRMTGIRLDGTLRLSGSLKVAIHDCTLGPAATAIDFEDDHGHGELTVELRASIAGDIRLPRSALLEIENSIVRRIAGPDIEGAAEFGPVLTIRNSTVFGEVLVEALLLACGVIFTACVEAVNQLDGCVRFSYLPAASRVAAEYRCLPGDRQPRFTSTRFGHPGYGQLAINCPNSFRHAAEDGDEIGAGHITMPLVRRQLLESTISEFLPLGLECEVSYVT